MFKTIFTIEIDLLVIFTLEIENAQVSFKVALTKKVEKFNISSTWSLFCLLK
jgi:hypothetical protein